MVDSIIEREEKEWGVRLIVRPFEGHLQHLQLSAEIAYPTGNGSPVTSITTHGLGRVCWSEAKIWHQSLAFLLVEAKKVSQEIRQARKTAKRTAKSRKQ